MEKTKLDAAVVKYGAIAKQQRGSVMSRNGLSKPDQAEINEAIETAAKGVQQAPPPDLGQAAQGNQPPPPDQQNQQQAPPPIQNGTASPFNPDNPDLTEFNYHNDDGFRGKSFKKYFLELMPKLNPHKKYQFEEYQIKAIRVDRFPGSNESPKDIIGVKILKTTPIKTTFMEARMAAQMNGVDVQVYLNSEGDKVPTIAGAHFFNGMSNAEGRIYLLKKS